jgi:hypothetical protein
MSDGEPRLDGARSILLEEPPISHGQDTCTDLLVGGASAPHVLFVTYTRRAADCLQQVTDEGVESVGVITVGDAVAETDDDSVSTDRVSTPSDLTGLGIKIDEYLSSRGTPVHICFDSVTSALQYVDYETVYKFVHAMNGKIHAADARVHYHIDPSAHSDEEVAGLVSLFDARLSVGGDERTAERRKLLE